MKKTLAVLLSLTMLFALCIPGFAANPITEKSEQSGTGLVHTDTSTEPANGTYSVSFPADMPIKWGAESTSFSYKVQSQLVAGKHLQVAVAQQSTEKVMTLKNGTETLAYALDGEVNFTAAKEVVGTTNTEGITTPEEHTFKVNVQKADWAKASLGEYQDNLTFTVSIA